MKLTNISLAILVAVGVAACGGSDDNNSNKPNDNKPTPTPTPTPDNSNKPVDPQRAAPDMSIQDAVKSHVVSAKTTYAAAGARDLLTGYAPNAGIVGVGEDPLLNDGSLYAEFATDAADVKRLAETQKDGATTFNNAINYVATGQVRKDATNADYNGAVLANPGFTYALGADARYYRMKPVDDAGADIAWHETKPTTRYVPVGQDVAAKPGTPGSGTPGTPGYVPPTPAIPASEPSKQFPGGFVSQDKLVFLPNVTRTTGGSDDTLAVKNTNGGANIDNTPGGVDRINSKDYTKTNSPYADSAKEAPLANGADSDPGTPGTPGIPGGILAGQKAQPFNVENGEVIFKTANFLGKAYSLESADAIQKVDLNDIPLNKSEIQYLPVSVNYDVKDTKGTNVMADDSLIRKETKVGAMKAYNLPYSLAFVTVNQKGAEKKRMTDGAAARNLFDYADTGKYGDLGSFQVVGYQSPYLPENGRADYTGKSFGVDSQGDVKLRADFGIRGAHIGGSITNRTYADGNGTLPEITLANIQLSSPGGDLHTTGTELFGNKAKEGQARARSNQGTWDVQLFGPDANEAGGVVQIDNDAVIPGGVEVFTTQRGELTTDSNTAKDADIRK